METSVLAVLALSFAASVYLWIRIARSDDPRFMKVMLGIAVAIPVLGPLFWPFLSMPPRLPKRLIAIELYRGPVGPWPKRPRRVAIAYRVLVGLIALAMILAHAWLIHAALQ